MSAPESGDLSPARALEILISGDDDARHDLIAALEAAPPNVRFPLRTRLLEMLGGSVPSPSKVWEVGPPSDPVVRGWLVSAAAAATPEPDGELMKQLLSRLDPQLEPADWIRYWSLANLNWKYPYEAPKQAERAREDPSPLVRALALAIQAQQRQGLLDEVVKPLTDLRNVEQTVASLRALQVTSFPDVGRTVALLLQSVSVGPNPSLGGDVQATLIYECLLALSNPATVDKNAPIAESIVSAARLAQLASTTAASRTRSRHTLTRIARLLSAMRDHEAVIRALRESAASRDAAVQEAGRLFLAQIGAAAAPAAAIPGGSARVDLVYRLVLQHPQHFELLETFNPTQLQQVVASIGTDLPEPAAPPNALWRAWIETVRGDRLSQD